MKITICGSMYFAKEMIEAKAKLEKLDHEILLPDDSEKFIGNAELNADFDFISGGGYMMGHFKKIETSDAILVMNYEKKGIHGYIGGSTLIETGIAYYLGKKIFIMNDLPSEDTLSYIFEVKLTSPVIINNNLSLIK